MASSLAEVVRELRNRALLSQEELAERSGLSIGTIRGLEAGRVRRPRAASVRRLADVLVATESDRWRLLAAAGGRPATEGARPGVVPAQLPAAVSGFVGRADALRALDNMLDAGGAGAAAPVMVSAIAGMAGIGKTALVVTWAHRVADRFPDGQLYVNLRGFGAARAPMASEEAVRGLLDGLQVPPQRIPSTLDARVGLYRSLLAQRRMLLVLDNARDADQVRPLLPGAAGCLAVVTSRSRLAGLAATDGARVVTLDVLSHDEARQLFVHRVGEGRVAVEPEAVDDIVDRCGGLPLALAIVAARAATPPLFPLAALAAQLRDTGLDAVTGGDQLTDIRSVFGWSYRALNPAAAGLFRLLGLHPGPDLTASAAASLAGIPVVRARRLLADLVAANLVIEHAPGRYTLHDLLHSYAAELAEAVDPAPERRDALHRLLDHYLHAACTADQLINPQRAAITLPMPQAGACAVPFGSVGEALDWFHAEYPVLRAAVALAARYGFDTHPWQLAWSLTGFVDSGERWLDLIQDAREAILAARHPGDQARAHLILGHAYLQAGRPVDAESHLRRSLDLDAGNGDHNGRATTHLLLNRLHAGRSDTAGALRHAHRARVLYGIAGHQAGVAFALNSIGWLHAQRDELQQAAEYCGQALTLHRKTGSRFGEATTLHSLGDVHRRLGQLPLANARFREALALSRELGHRAQEAITLDDLGVTYAAAGEPEAARDVWAQALVIYRALDLPDQVAQIEAKLHGLR